jgi:hypothetical protein
LNIPAGKSAVGKIEITNPSEEVKKISVSALDWVYSDDLGAKEFFPGGTKDLSCAKWISFVPAEFSINPSGKEYLQYTIRAPDNAKGGYNAVLFFESLLGEAPKDSGDSFAIVPVAIRVGSLIAVEIDGTVERKAQVDNLSFKEEGGVYKIEADFLNNGNADIIVAGSYNILNKENEVFARGEFANRYTLPGGKARLSAVCKEKFSPGSYQLIITLDLGRSLAELGMGRGPLKVIEADMEAGKDGKIKLGALR